MDYKESKYNIAISNNMGTNILYNTRTGRYVVLSQKVWNTFRKIICGDMRHDTVEKYLIENGFCVDKNSDESIPLFVDGSAKNLNVTIMPTMACNFRCPYCFEEHISQRMTGDIENAVIDYLKERVKGYNHLHVQWYGGEPLLEMDIITRLSTRILELCNENSIPYTSSMTTNGFFLSWKNYLKLKSMHIRSYVVTIDGIKQDHDKTRIQSNGAPSFDQIVENLTTIRDRDHSALTRFIIRTNYTASSIQNKNEWEQWLNKNFLNDFRFKYIPRYAWDNYKGTYDEKQYISFEFNDNVDIVDLIDIDLLSSTTLNEELFSCVEQCLLDLHNRTLLCVAGQKNSITIAPNGHLLKCQVLIDNPINDVGAVDSATGKIYTCPQKLAYWETRGEEYQFCMKCPLYPFCLSRGCAAKTGDIDKINERWCSALRKQVEKYLTILSYKSISCDVEETLESIK